MKGRFRSSVCRLAGFAVVGTVVLGISTWSAAQVNRTYYVAAEEIEWSYGAAMGHASTMSMGGEMDMDSEMDTDGMVSTSRVYPKVAYREYTDSSFSQPKERSPQWRHLGILGPVIHAEVGDTISFVFHNLASRPYNVHAYGVQYGKDGEGVLYEDGNDESDDDLVFPGATHTYFWRVPEDSGPGPGDGPSVVWPYYSHVQTKRDISSGLMGVIVVTSKGQARPDGRPMDVDREFVAVLTVIDEGQSWYASSGTAVMPVINGYSQWQNIAMCTGERVRWYLLALGGEAFLHWHGNTGVVSGSGRRADIINLMPSSGVVLDMSSYNPGVWMLISSFRGQHPAITHTTYQVITAGQPGCRR